MAVTRSTAADRRRAESSAPPARPARPASPVQGMPGPAPRPQPRGRCSPPPPLVVLLGLVLAYLAMAKPLAEVEPKLASGEMVNLNDLRSADQLLPLLDVFDSSAERSFVAQEIWKRAHQGTDPQRRRARAPPRPRRGRSRETAA